MNIFRATKEMLEASPVGQSILFMLQHQQPIVTALVPMNKYSIVYPHPEGGTFTMEMDYQEVLNLHEAVKIMKDAGELYFFDETKVKYVM